jgi:hypothetical protein
VASAEANRYRDSKTFDTDGTHVFSSPDAEDDVLDDLTAGACYKEAVRGGVIQPGDILLHFSTDGAQAERGKASDIWFGAFQNTNLPPSQRFRKENVLHAFAVPGPSAPKCLASFAYPVLRQLNRYRTHGIWIYDAAEPVEANRWRQRHLLLYLALADTLGQTQWNGRTGHNSPRGCRFSCDLIGLRPPTGSIYYPACSVPHGVENRVDSRQDSIHPGSLPVETDLLYEERVAEILRAPTSEARKKLQFKYSILGPSVFYRLSIVGGVTCHPQDCMHWASALSGPQIQFASRSLMLVRCSP